MNKARTFTVTVVEHDGAKQSGEHLTDLQRQFVRQIVKEMAWEYDRTVPSTNGATKERKIPQLGVVGETRGTPLKTPVINPQASQPLPTTGFVRLPQILSVFPISKTSWWDGVRSGRYPKPVKLSTRCTAWKADDIHRLMSEINNRDSKIERPRMPRE